MWGLGVIAYLLVSGGVSPFFDTSRYKIMTNILHCRYNFHQPNFALLSDEATDFISKLLGEINQTTVPCLLKLALHFTVTDPLQRYTASDCLKHPWLGFGFGLR